MINGHKMERKKTFLITFVILLTTIFLFKLLGISLELITLNYNDLLMNINWVYFILIILLFPLSFSIISLYSITNKELDKSIIFIPIITSLFIFYFFGINYLSIFASLGIIAAVFITSRSSFFEKQIYVKPMVYRVSTYSVRRSLLLLNILVIIGLFITISSDASYGENIINDFIDNMINSTISKEQYQQIDTNLIKNEIRNSISGMENLINLFPYFMILTAWIILELLRNIVLTPLTGIYSVLGWRLLEMNKDKKVSLDNYKHGS